MAIQAKMRVIIIIKRSAMDFLIDIFLIWLTLLMFAGTMLVLLIGYAVIKEIRND